MRLAAKSHEFTHSGWPKWHCAISRAPVAAVFAARALKLLTVSLSALQPSTSTAFTVSPSCSKSLPTSSPSPSAAVVSCSTCLCPASHAATLAGSMLLGCLLGRLVEKSAPQPSITPEAVNARQLERHSARTSGWVWSYMCSPPQPSASCPDVLCSKSLQQNEHP